MDEGLEVHKVREAWRRSAFGRTTSWIIPTIDRKIAALHEHRTQFSDPDGLAERIRERAAGAANGLALAEGFGASYPQQRRRAESQRCGRPWRRSAPRAPSAARGALAAAARPAACGAAGVEVLPERPR
ncbi:MAG: hypothetical protein U0470_07170 [Anaerolineae bacterium]